MQINWSRGNNTAQNPMFVKALANEDTLLPTQMFPRLPARTTFVADTKNVSDFVQKHFVYATNASQFAQHGNTTFILCPGLRAQETKMSSLPVP